MPWRFCHNTQPAAAAATRAFSGKRREVAAAAAAPNFPRSRGPDLPERCLPYPLPHMECPLKSSSNGLMIFALKHQRQHIGAYFNTVWTLDVVCKVLFADLQNFLLQPSLFVNALLLIDIRKLFHSLLLFAPWPLSLLQLIWGLNGRASSSVFN